jgi:hypothetical protein
MAFYGKIKKRGKNSRLSTYAFFLAYAAALLEKNNIDVFLHDSIA